MKIIEIRTTQNVVLQYELADLRDRIVAFLIDLACVSIAMGILMTIVGNIFTGTALSVMVMIVLCVFIFYSLGFELLNRGQSIGKMAMRLQVVKTTSGQPAFADYAARWVFRLVDIYFSLGGLASILIASSSKAQRIGDIVANTTVIKLTPKMNLELKDILGIHSRNSYRPEYTQAKQLTEENALLIKTTLDRYRRYGNKSHYEALNLLAEKIAQILQVQKTENNNQQFLETVLKDYVTLTR